MTVAFTGHRQINGVYAPDGPWKQVLIIAMQTINILHHKYNHTDFIAGGALGFDTMAACAILSLKNVGVPIRLILALPFEGFDSKWTHKSKVLFESTINSADEVHYVCDPGYAPWKMNKRNEWMVDRAKTMVALLNPDIQKGGTINCLKYATKLGKSIIVINPITMGVEGGVFDPATGLYKEVPI